MSNKSYHRSRTQDDEGFRVPRHTSKQSRRNHLKEKRLHNTLRSAHNIDLSEFDEEDWDLDDEDLGYGM